MKHILVAIFLGLPRTRDHIAQKSRVKSNATDKKRKKKKTIKFLIMIFYYTPWSMPWNTHLKMREICLHQICLHQISFLGAQRILWKRRQKKCRTQRGKEIRRAWPSKTTEQSRYELTDWSSMHRSTLGPLLIYYSFSPEYVNESIFGSCTFS